MQVYRYIWLLLALQVAAPAVAAPDGQRLYERNCAACHGIDGTGGVGVPLALPDFQYQVSDDYLATTIRLGRPGRVMPAFTDLSPAEVKALVKYVRSWAPGRPVGLSKAPVQGDPKRGKVLYQQNCASCHGAEGRGSPGTGVTFSRQRKLPIMAPALNNPGFLAAASDQMIKAALMNGREGTPMDSFLKKGLSEGEIDDIVSYVRSFQDDAPATDTPAAAEPATLVYESPFDLETTVQNIERAVVGKNFRPIRTQPLEEGLVAEGQEDPNQVIVYFCNFDFLDRALAIDPRVGLFLPCRVTALERDGKVQVMSINPKRLSTLFNNSELDRLCDDMHELYTGILEEATF